jgi:SAM-dependent methyltransferase
LRALPEPIHALKFGNAARDYERGRPDWPAAALVPLPVVQDAEVLDLAAGTGKLTTLLAARYARVVAVEPDDSMRALIEGVETHGGSAESIPLADSSVDGVFVAEAFHWFDGDRALAEIARVLRPRGFLALIWSGGWEFDPPLPERVGELLQEVFARTGRPGGPLREAGVWRRAFAGAPFEPLRESRFEHEVIQEPDETVSLWLSISSVAALPAADRAELGRKLRELITEPHRLRVGVELYWTRLNA